MGVICVNKLFQCSPIVHVQYTVAIATNPTVFPLSLRLKLVLPWIMAAFSGVVSVEQLLILWDLIIGYDSLELLPCESSCIIIF